MKDKRAGFTLIELLVVISILSLLIVKFAPDLLSAWSEANKAADQQNMRTIFSWIENNYKNKTNHYPLQGGHKFVLAPWVDNAVEHSVANFDRFVNPALQKENATWAELRKGDLDHTWTNYNEVDSTCTDYAGRAKEFLKGIDSAKEAWLADDNEDRWAFKDGTINVLYGDGNVVPLTSIDLRDKYNWPEIVADQPFPSFGAESPVPELKKLDR